MNYVLVALFFISGVAVGYGINSCAQAQSSFLDFGTITDQKKSSEIQQWWVDKEIRNGRNPFVENPCR
jgi:hypothetical protein